MKNNSKILIVEDEVLIANFILKMLQKEGFSNLEIANDVETAKAKFNSFRPDIILLDINLEESNTGIDLAAKKNEDAKIIYLTAQNDIETIKKAIATNPISYLTKPIKKPDLLAAINLCLIKQSESKIVLK